MKNEEALNVLLTAVRIGQSKGAYSLEDARVIAVAVEMLSPKQTETHKVQEEKK